jgi:hypothetical protein
VPEVPAIAFPLNEFGFAESYEFADIRGVYLCRVAPDDDESDEDWDRRRAVRCGTVPPEPECGIGVEFTDGDHDLGFTSPDHDLVCAVYAEYLRQRAAKVELIDIGAIRDEILAKRREGT